MKGVCECPICGDDTVHIPILDWTHEFNERTGEVMLTAHYDYDNAFCKDGCNLTNVEPKQYHVIGFVEEGGY